MDRQLKADIKFHFYKEYKASALSKPGLMGKFMRLQYWPQSRRSLFTGLGIAAGGVLVAAAIAPEAFVTALIAGAFALCLAGGVAALTSMLALEVKVTMAQNKDIKNRTLINRYKEAVDQNLQELPAASATQAAARKAALKKLSQQLSEEFPKAANGTQTAKPARAHRFSPRRLLRHH